MKIIFPGPDSAYGGCFYWGDTGPNAKDEYTSGYKLLQRDEDTINIIGEVLHTLIKNET